MILAMCYTSIELASLLSRQTGDYDNERLQKIMRDVVCSKHDTLGPVDMAAKTLELYQTEYQTA